MRKVHPTKQLFHLFCNMIDADMTDFRNPQRSVYFEGGVLYSYGPHYPMAKKYRTGTGSNHREVILLNSSKSTATTEKHKSQLYGSTKPNQWVFRVPDIEDPWATENEVHLMNNIVEAADAIIRGLSHWDIDRLTRQVGAYNQYAEAFKLKKFSMPVDFYTDLAIKSKETAAKVSIRDAKRHERQSAQREFNRKENEKRDLELKEKASRWTSDTSIQNIPLRYFEQNYDPIRVNGDKVESPRGAEVSLDEAQFFCMHLRQGKVQEGMKIGHFEVLSIDSEIVEIGCHRINIKQAIEAVLGKLEAV